MTNIDWYKSCAYNEPQKHLFHREARKRLQALAEALCLPRRSYSIRSNKGGVAAAGEVTLHHESIYVQISQPATGADSGILIRSCQGRKDYTGGPNRYAPLSILDDLAALADKVNAIMAAAAAQQNVSTVFRADTPADQRSSHSETDGSPTAPSGEPKTWTIRCIAHLPTVNTVEVEAATLEEACEKAIAAANDSSHWETCNQIEQTFVDGYCEGRLKTAVDILTDMKSDVPYAFSQDGLRPRPTIKILVSGGIVQDVTCDGAAIVIVHDEDNEAQTSPSDSYEPSEYRFPS
jgi:hypothetical protein